jgi:uncharacterized Zn-finger protein
MTNEINCNHCGTKIKFIGYTGYPIYYLGSGPYNPKDAEVFFCGPYCSTHYVINKKEKKE